MRQHRRDHHRRRPGGARHEPLPRPARGIDHVVLERGRVAERWRSERWDSLRLLTPNWMSRLPGWSYHGVDPDGFMTTPEFAALSRGYARATCGAGRDRTPPCGPCGDVPAATGSRRDRGVWHARVRGDRDRALRCPARAGAWRCILPASIHQVTPSAYRNPAELPDGGVLVVGASASGVQIAEEIQRSGRPVTHLRRASHAAAAPLPRPRHHVVAGSHRRARRDRRAVHGSCEPPGAAVVAARRPAGRTQLDLGTLHDIGVRVVGHAAGMTRRRAAARRRPGATTVAAAQARARAPARPHRRVGRCAPALPPSPWPAGSALRARRRPRSTSRPRASATVVWATGFKRDYRLAARAGARCSGRDHPRAAASPPPRASTSSACASCGAGARASSTASAPMPRSSPTTSPATSHAADLCGRVTREQRYAHPRHATMPWSSARAAPAPPLRC